MKKNEIIKQQTKTIIKLIKEINYLKSKIDSLMLEFCPEEMTTDQLLEWGNNQICEDKIKVNKKVLEKALLELSRYDQQMRSYD